MTQEKRDALPDHLKAIDFGPHHVYINTKVIKGKTVTTMTASENLITDLMRQHNLGFSADMVYVGPFREGKTLIVMKVAIRTKVGERETPAYASVDAMPYEKTGSGTHLAQLALTQAKKKGVLNHLYITPNDIKLLVEAWDIDMNQKTTQSSARAMIEDDDGGDSEEAIIEPEVDANLSLDDIV